MKSKITSILFFTLFLSVTYSTECYSQATITVDATGEILIPADIVDFQINIRVSGRTPAEVFEKHKEQERFLAGLIREHGLEGDELNFQPMNIGNRQTRDATEYVSNQNVNLRLDDFSLYEEIQVLLIENGFENFSGRFSSTDIESGENEALDLAISDAIQKAGRIADNIGKTLGSIKSIDHTASRVVRGYESELSVMRADTGSMMEFEQTIPVTSSVRIVFYISD